HQEAAQFDGDAAAAGGQAAVATAGTGSSAAGDISLGENGLPVGVTIRREVAKVGRNDACPCGSGKKFKQCCGK
ncbi:MAG: SEC-C metal-binding domain-containing protein, partial [bacterium]